MSTYLGNPALKDTNVKIQWTDQRISELEKCQEDPVYFITKYIQVVTIDEGVTDFKLWKFQANLIKTVHEERFTIAVFPRQSGKALSLDTPIPTKDGWTTMGDLKISDEILGSNGKITKVKTITEIMENHKCYRVSFDNGDSVIADEDHLWKIGSSFWEDTEKIKTTKKLIEDFKKQQACSTNIYINLPDAVEFPEKELPIDPYILGIWLGDGHSSDSRFTQLYSDMEEISKHIISEGYFLKEAQGSNKREKCSTWNIIGLYSKLRINNLIHNKHIPKKYLRSSINQRLALIQGLMDTDGTCDKRGICLFSQKKKEIIDSFREILSSLGIKSRVRSRIIKGQIYYSVIFKTHKFNCFRLTRKLKRQNIQIGKERKNTNVLYIKNIEEVNSVPVKCIQVENEDHMFLCGTTMIPTHNSTTLVAYFLHYILFNKHKKIGILANKRETAIELLAKVQLAFELLPMWLQQGVKVWNKTRIELENGCVISAHSTSSASIRGQTFNIIFLDEFAHIDNKLADKFWTSTYPVISQGKTSKLIIVSTPNGINLFYELWTKANLSHDNPDWNQFHALEVLNTEVPGRENPEWAEKTISIIGESRYAQEYLCEFLGSGHTLIAGKFLKQMIILPPKHSQNHFDVWKDPSATQDEPHMYVIAIDTAKGKQLDYSALTIIDVTDAPYEVVAKYRSNTVPPVLFADEIVPIAQRYNNAFIIIEIDGPGYQVADDLHHIHEYPNILYVATKGRSGQILATGFGNTGKNVQRGVKMSTPVRRTGCANLKTLIETRKLIVYDQDIKDELASFVLKGDKYQADENKHDDLVMTLVTFSWLTTQKHFRDLVDAKLRESLQDDYAPNFDQDLTPYGWVNNGLEEEEVVLTQQCIWKGAQSAVWEEFAERERRKATIDIDAMKRLHENGWA